MRLQLRHLQLLRCSTSLETSAAVVASKQFHSKSSSSSRNSRFSSNNHHQHNHHRQQQQQQKNSAKWSGSGFWTASGFLVGGGIAYWAYQNRPWLVARMFSGDDGDPGELDPPMTPSNKNKPTYGRANINFIADIVEQVSASVVNIESQVHHPIFQSMVSQSSGSGFLVDKQEGVILTNAHVIANSKQVFLLCENYLFRD